ACSTKSKNIFFALEEESKLCIFFPLMDVMDGMLSLLLVLIFCIPSPIFETNCFGEANTIKLWGSVDKILPLVWCEEIIIAPSNAARYSHSINEKSALEFKFEWCLTFKRFK